MSSQLQIQSLGRPFKLGMLYNCYSDSLLPGSMLCKEEKSSSSPKESSRVKDIIEDSIQSKFAILLDNSDDSIDALNIKLNVMSELVKVGGAEQYLHDFKVSARQVRVTLCYSCTTHFEHLPVDREYSSSEDATHVVTGITYGTDVFFVFDHHVGENESLEDAKKKLKTTIESARSNSPECTKSENITCKFYGDAILESNPTFLEAIKLYNNFPSRLTSDAKSSVAKVIYLSPLPGLSQKVVRPISVEHCTQVLEVFDYLHYTEMRINDLIQDRICDQFINLKSQLSKFMNLLSYFKTSFKNEVSQLLPCIRKSEEDEGKLAELVAEVKKSPFNSDSTNKYLTAKGNEIKLLFRHLEDMKTNYEKLIFDFTMAFANDNQSQQKIYFAFNVTSETCTYIDTLDTYIQNRGKELNFLIMPQAEKPEWFDRPEIEKQMRDEKEKLLCLTKQDSIVANTSFVVTNSTKQFYEYGPSLILYKAGDASLLDLPGTPEEVEITNGSVTLTWAAPKHGDILWYKILYCLKGEQKFQSTDNLGEVPTTHCIKDLRHGSEYHFKVQAMTAMGFALESEVYCTKTKADYYDIVLVGKTGQGRSTLGNKLLDLENTDNSNIQLFETSTSVDNTSSTATSRRKRFFQANDPEVQECSDQLKCNLMANEATKVRVLDVPGFSDTGTLKKTLGMNATVYDGNLQIIRYIVREQLEHELKVRRIVYFLPARGVLEKADGIIQEELRMLYHFLGKKIFNCMVVIATNPPKKKFQELDFDELDIQETKKVFLLALRTAIGDKNISCPPIIFIGLNETPQKILNGIKSAQVLNDGIIPLKFKDSTCARCSLTYRCNESNDPISIVHADGNTFPYAESKCHPSFKLKYSMMTRIVGGTVHLFTLNYFAGDKARWPGFKNSDEVCVNCEGSPSTPGCVLVGQEHTFYDTIKKDNVTVKTDHTSEL